MGDFQGHPFRGNQWTDGSGGSGVPTGRRPMKSSAEYPPMNPNAKTTRDRFSDGKGGYTPERKARHQEIVAEALDGTTPVRKKVAQMVGGGPSAGKSTARESMNPENTVTVDVDQIRQKLPEYQEQAGSNKKIAEITHDEASEIGKKIVSAAAANNRNLLIDGTGNGSYEEMVDRVSKLRANDYAIEAKFVVVEPERALKRMKDRAETPGPDFGRYVPEDYLLDTHRGIAKGLPRLIKAGGFDKIEIYDNNQDPPESLSGSEKKAWIKAHPPKLIYRRTGRFGADEIIDPVAWEKFLRSGDE